LIGGNSKVGLQVHEEKVDYMVMGRKDSAATFPQLKVGRYRFSRAKEVKYLGSIVTEKNETDQKLASRILSRNKCFYELTKILGSRSLATKMKKQLHTILIRPEITYEAKAWLLRKNEERKLLVFERKMLRKIFGPVKDRETGKWIIRKNEEDELERLFRKENILSTIRSRRLPWAGHAVRSQNSIIRMIMDENQVSKKPLERPRLRWEDVIRNKVEALHG